MTPHQDDPIERLAGEIERFLGQPHFFAEIVPLVPEGRYRDVLRAWGRLRDRVPLARDEEGRYVVARASAKEGRS